VNSRNVEGEEAENPGGEGQPESYECDHHNGANDDDEPDGLSSPIHVAHCFLRLIELVVNRLAGYLDGKPGIWRKTGDNSSVLNPAPAANVGAFARVR
jgi:hypothetical protein